MKKACVPVIVTQSDLWVLLVLLVPDLCPNLAIRTPKPCPQQCLYPAS